MARLAQANVEIFKELLAASLGDGTPYQVTLDFLDEKLKGLISEEQKVQLLSTVLSTITTQFTVQAMESSRSLALEDLLFDKKEQLMDEEIKKAKSQVELAGAEIEFNKARTALVNSQNESEKEKKKNIIREREAMNDQLRIKEAEFLSNVNFGYAAGGVAVPEDLQKTMLNAVDKITPLGV